MHQLFIGFKKAYDSVKREVLYNTLIDTGIPMKMVRLINMCLNESYNRVWVGKNLCEVFHIRDGLKQGDDQSPLVLNFGLDMPLGGFR